MMFETVANYVYLGRPLVLYDDTALLMEHGIVRLEKGTAPRAGKDGAYMAEYGGTLEEPIVIQALMNISLRRFNPFRVLLAEDDRSKGYTFESACIAMLMGLMNGKGPEEYIGNFADKFHLGAGTLPKLTTTYKKWLVANPKGELQPEIDALNDEHTKLKRKFTAGSDQNDNAWKVFKKMDDAKGNLNKANPKTDNTALQIAYDEAKDDFDTMFARLPLDAQGQLQKIIQVWADLWAKRAANKVQQYSPYWDSVKAGTRVAMPDYCNMPFRIHLPSAIGKPLVTPFDKESPIKEFFKKPPTPFYTPGTFYGPDLAFVLEFLPPPPPVAGMPRQLPFFIPAFLQAKFEAGSGEDAGNIEKAILKSDPMIVAHRNKQLAGDVASNIKKLRDLLQDEAGTKFKYKTMGSIRFVFRASKATQGLVPRAFIDAADVKDPADPEDGLPPSLVIYLEKNSLLQCFPDPDFENALKVRVPWVAK